MWKIFSMKNKHVKYAPCHRSLGKCKLKQQGTLDGSPARMAKIPNLTAPNAGADEKQQELSFLLVATDTFEDSLAVSYKTKHTHTIPSSNCIP